MRREIQRPDSKHVGNYAITNTKRNHGIRRGNVVRSLEELKGKGGHKYVGEI